MRKILIAAPLIALLTGCVSFYPNPGTTEPAAVFIEKGERSALDRYRYFTVAEIDGLPVSHMGVMSSDGNEIRVQPGIRRMVFTVSLLNGFGTGIHRIHFPLELDVKTGKRYKIEGSASEDNQVVFKINDLSAPDTPWVHRNGTARPVKPNMTIPVQGGGVVTIPSR